MTDKEVFEQVKTHLLKQGKRSIRANPDKNARNQASFAWWGDDGTKSALGCLMTTSSYKEEFEKYKSIEALLSIFEATALFGFEVDGNRLLMLASLEAIHDERPSEWARLLAAEGRKFNSLGEYMWGAM